MFLLVEGSPMSTLKLDTPLLTVHQVAEALGCSHWTIRRMISRGELKAVRIGQMLRIDPREVRKVIKPVTNAADLLGGAQDV